MFLTQLAISRNPTTKALIITRVPLKGDRYWTDPGDRIGNFYWPTDDLEVGMKRLQKNLLADKRQLIADATKDIEDIKQWT